MKFGLIATGRIAETSLRPPSTRRRRRAGEVYSRDKQRADDFAARHGAASETPGYDDLDAMLADQELDAVLSRLRTNYTLPRPSQRPGPGNTCSRRSQ